MEPCLQVQDKHGFSVSNMRKDRIDLKKEKKKVPSNTEWTDSLYDLDFFVTFNSLSVKQGIPLGIARSTMQSYRTASPKYHVPNT